MICQKFRKLTERKNTLCAAAKKLAKKLAERAYI